MKFASFNYLLSLCVFTAFTTVASEPIAQSDDDGQLVYVELTEIGDPARVLHAKREEPKSLKAGEVRVKVLATPIHPSNLLQISGQYGVAPTIPSTPGSEGVGQVIETSAEVNHLQSGQLVLLVGGGTWREEIVAPASQFIPLPNFGTTPQETVEQLSMTVVNPLTAFLMLTNYVELKEGDWIVQSASNSAVGGYLIQLAKQRGVKTVNVVRREGLADELHAKGADVVLVDGPDLADRIASSTGGAPVALAIDAVGGATFARLADSLNYGGTLVSYGVMSGQPVTFNPAVAIFNDVRIRGFWLSKWFQTAEASEQQATFGKIVPLVIDGSLSADIDSRFGLDQIKQAVTRAGQRGRNGKVLLLPNVQ